MTGKNVFHRKTIIQESFKSDRGKCTIIYFALLLCVPKSRPDTCLSCADHSLLTTHEKKSLLGAEKKGLDSRLQRELITHLALKFNFPMILSFYKSGEKKHGNFNESFTMEYIFPVTLSGGTLWFTMNISEIFRSVDCLVAFSFVRNAGALLANATC